MTGVTSCDRQISDIYLPYVNISPLHVKVEFLYYFGFYYKTTRKMIVHVLYDLFCSGNIRFIKIFYNIKNTKT